MPLKKDAANPSRYLSISKISTWFHVTKQFISLSILLILDTKSFQPVLIHDSVILEYRDKYIPSTDSTHQSVSQPQGYDEAQAYPPVEMNNACFK